MWAGMEPRCAVRCRGRPGALLMSPLPRPPLPEQLQPPSGLEAGKALPPRPCYPMTRNKGQTASWQTKDLTVLWKERRGKRGREGRRGPTRMGSLPPECSPEPGPRRPPEGWMPGLLSRAVKMCHSAPRPRTEPDTEQVPNTPVSGGAARTVPHRPRPCGDLHSSPVPLNMAEMGSERQATALRRTFHLQLDR